MAKKEEKPLTHKDLLRLIKENGHTARGLNLTGRNLEGTDLSGLNLRGVILSKANLSNANLQGVDLRGVGAKRVLTREIVTQGLTSPRDKSHQLSDDYYPILSEPANLEEADLAYANLTDARLWGVNMLRAMLVRANLQGANLWRADLRYVDLGGANLQSTILLEANMTLVSLHNTRIYPSTDLREVNWGADYILWEEKAHAFEEVEREYRELKNWHNQAGLYSIAGEFYYREITAKRKSLLDFTWLLNAWFMGEERPRLHPIRWAWSMLLNILCGYGERPFRVATSAVVVIFGLAAAYYFWGSFSSSSFGDTLYYSAASFTALGYGQWAPQPTGWARGMGAAEAVIGVFMMALFLITFIRKMTR